MQVSLPLEQLRKAPISDVLETPGKDGRDGDISGKSGSSTDDMQQDGSRVADDSLRDLAVEHHQHIDVDESADGQTNYLHGVKLLMLMITLMTGQFIMGMDTTVISVYIPAWQSLCSTNIVQGPRR